MSNINRNSAQNFENQEKIAVNIVTSSTQCQEGQSKTSSI